MTKNLTNELAQELYHIMKDYWNLFRYFTLIIDFMSFFHKMISSTSYRITNLFPMIFLENSSNKLDFLDNYLNFAENMQKDIRVIQNKISNLSKNRNKINKKEVTSLRNKINKTRNYLKEYVEENRGDFFYFLFFDLLVIFLVVFLFLVLIKSVWVF